jgi:autotransporter-associated beta strand protein
VGSGGAIIDTAGFNVTVASALNFAGAGGGLTKQGNGTLILTSGTTYQGTTTVSSGTLVLRDSATHNAAASFYLADSTLSLIGVTSSNIQATNLTLSDSSAIIATSASLSVTSTVVAAESVNQTATLASSIAGPASFSHLGAGTLQVAARQFLSGLTSITAGTVNLASTGGFTSTVSVNGSGTLAGTGSASGVVTVASGGRVSPGSAFVANSMSTLTVGSAIFNPGGTFVVDFLHPPTNSDGVVGTAGTEWDKLKVLGSLDISNLSASSKFTLRLQRQQGDNASFEDPTLVNGYGQWRWSNAITFGSLAGSFAAANFDVQASGFAGSFFSSSGGGTPTGTFGVELNGNNGFDIVYTIPEPATVALLAGLGALGLAVLRRRQTRR